MRSPRDPLPPTGLHGCYLPLRRSRSKATFTSTSVLPNLKTAFSFAPSIELRTRLSMHNTFRCFLPGWEDLGLSPAPRVLPRSQPCMYHLLLGWGCFFLSGFWFLYPAFPRFGFGLLRRAAPRLVLCCLRGIIGRNSGLDGLSPANASVVLESGSYSLCSSRSSRVTGKASRRKSTGPRTRRARTWPGPDRAARDPSAARPIRRPEPVSALFYPAKPTSVNTWRRNPPGRDLSSSDGGRWARARNRSEGGVKGHHQGSPPP